MLFQLILYRMIPLVIVGSLKEKKRMKVGIVLVGGTELVLLVLAVKAVLSGCGITGILWLVAAALPQGLFYGFVVVLVIKCLWNAWSKRVWSRIFRLSMILIFLGILAEVYINPLILQFFEKIS